MKREYHRPDVWLAAHREAQRYRRTAARFRAGAFLFMAVFALTLTIQYGINRLRIPEPPAPPTIAYRTPETGVSSQCSYTCGSGTFLNARILSSSVSDDATTTLTLTKECR